MAHMFVRWHIQLHVTSSKKETHEVVICVFTQVWVSVFRCTYTFTCPSFTTHTCTHHLEAKLVPILTHTFPGVVLAGGEKQQWSGTGLFFSAGQTLARPKGGSHPIPPEVPLVWDPFEPPPAERTSL